MLTSEEQSAIRWYIGDIEGSDAHHPALSDPKAYVVINSLFYPGICTERARAAEGKRLNPAILSDPAWLKQTLTALLCACQKCALHEERTVYRVERAADYAICRERGETIGFTSTSTAGFLPAYTDRKGIVLLTYTLPPGTPCIPMQDALPHYAKAEEAEILLPPGLRLTLTERQPSLTEQCILDADGTPPVCSVAAVPSELHAVVPAMQHPDGAAAGQRVFTALMRGEEPHTPDIEAYIRWKDVQPF